MSSTILLSDTCSGPKCGLTLKMYTSFRLLKILAAENNPSDNSIGSHASHFSRGWFQWRPANISRRTYIKKKETVTIFNEIIVFNRMAGRKFHLKV